MTTPRLLSLESVHYVVFTTSLTAVGLQPRLLSVTTLLAAAEVQRTRADADQLLRKIAVIATHGLAAQSKPLRTPVTESEVNSFLEFHARSEIPAGVLEPVVTIEEAGRLRGRALVDLDEVKKAQAGAGGFGVLSMLSGGSRSKRSARSTPRTASRSFISSRPW